MTCGVRLASVELRNNLICSSWGDSLLEVVQVSLYGERGSLWPYIADIADEPMPACLVVQVILRWMETPSARHEHPRKQHSGIETGRHRQQGASIPASSIRALGRGGIYEQARR